MAFSPMIDTIFSRIGRWRPGCLWAISGGAIGGGLFLLLIVLGFLWRSSAPDRPEVTPVLTIFVRPSISPIPVTQTALSFEPNPTDTPEQPALPQDSFLHGQLVAVFGTGGDGLRLRNQPSLNGIISFLALENEVFRVTDGPVFGEGYMWWHLVNPYDNNKTGWGVANYLRSVDSP